MYLINFNYYLFRFVFDHHSAIESELQRKNGDRKSEVTANLILEFYRYILHLNSDTLSN